MTYYFWKYTILLPHQKLKILYLQMILINPHRISPPRPTVRTSKNSSTKTTYHIFDKNLLPRIPPLTLIYPTPQQNLNTKIQEGSMKPPETESDSLNTNYFITPLHNNYHQPPPQDTLNQGTTPIPLITHPETSIDNNS